MSVSEKKRIIVGISGASGVVYGTRMLELLREAGVETHLVMSKSAEMTMAYETDYKAEDIRAMADQFHSVKNVGASISSGSFPSMGMVIAPCSIRTMSEIATGVTSALSEMGAIIAPPMPAFYNKPESVDDIVDHSVGRVLDLFDIDTGVVKRWGIDSGVD